MKVTFVSNGGNIEYDGVASIQGDTGSLRTAVVMAWTEAKKQIADGVILDPTSDEDRIIEGAVDSSVREWISFAGDAPQITITDGAGVSTKISDITAIRGDVESLFVVAVVMCFLAKNQNQEVFP